MRASSFLVLVVLLAAARSLPAEERLWTEKPPAKEVGAAVNAETFARLAEELSPAVVNIRIKRQIQGGGWSGDPLRDFFFGNPWQRGPQFGEGLGTGFVINPEGYVLTNNHVVEGAVAISASFKDGTELPAKLVGADPRTDLALLKLEGGRDLRAAPLGDSDRLRIGEWVLAIGNPFGLQHTVTAGIVSAKGRKEVQPGSEPMYANFIQTDASINPGNSGGPLINMRGEVVGINSAIVRSAQGIGFAIPSNMAKTLIPQLARGKVERSWMGVAVQEVTPALAKSMGIEKPGGALVRQVYPGSPAVDAGIQDGDVIVEFDGRPVQESSDLPWMAATAGVGAKVTVVLIREGIRKEVAVVMGNLADAGRGTGTAPAVEDAGGRSLEGAGLSLGDLTPQERRRLGAPSDIGVLVTGVDRGSAAAEAGFLPGDAILRLGTRPVTDVAALAERFARVRTGTHVPFQVLREGREHLWIAIVKP